MSIKSCLVAIGVKPKVENMAALICLSAGLRLFCLCLLLKGKTQGIEMASDSLSGKKVNVKRILVKNCIKTWRAM